MEVRALVRACSRRIVRSVALGERLRRAAAGCPFGAVWVRVDAEVEVECVAATRGRGPHA
jgi:hypothetical protein